MDELFGEVISEYSADQGVEDGILVYIFENRWPQLSGGKPIVATRAIVEAFSMAALIEIWNEYVLERQKWAPSQRGQTFVTQMNMQDVWVIEDGAAFTILFPSDY